MRPKRQSALLPLLGAIVLAGACRTVSPAETASPNHGAIPEPPAAVREVPDPIEESEFFNRIKWKTASELDNFGYNVYRGENADGPFERISPEVIEGAGTTDEPTAYEYVDRTIDPHETYYYYVESISMNGDRVRFTPIGKAKPKIAVEDDETTDRPGAGEKPES